MRLQSNKTILFFALFRNIENISISLLCIYSLAYENIMTFRLQFFNYNFFFILWHLEMQCVLFIERIWYHDFLIAISKKKREFHFIFCFLVQGSNFFHLLPFIFLLVKSFGLLLVWFLFFFFDNFHCFTRSNKNTLNSMSDIPYWKLTDILLNSNRELIIIDMNSLIWSYEWVD